MDCAVCRRRVFRQAIRDQRALRSGPRPDAPPRNSAPAAQPGLSKRASLCGLIGHAWTAACNPTGWLFPRATMVGSRCGSTWSCMVVGERSTKSASSPRTTRPGRFRLNRIISVSRCSAGAIMPIAGPAKPTCSRLLRRCAKRYKIDPRRIVLRGFSMGGAGAWHLGLHYPDRWAAVEAGAGFTETKRYAKQDNLPAYQDPAAHLRCDGLRPQCL